MAVGRQVPERALMVMVDACNEAEAPSCRVIARGSLRACCQQAAGASKGEMGRLAGGGRSRHGGLDNSDGQPQLQAGDGKVIVMEWASQ
jgi:hypothetical protein